MKIPNCPQSIFRPREANLYCTKPGGHQDDVHTFSDGTIRVKGVDTKPGVTNYVPNIFVGGLPEITPREAVLSNGNEPR